MRSISRLLTALGTLADSLLSLASVVDTAAAKLRQQLAIEEVHVIENRPADNATAEIQQLNEPATSKRNGRKAATV
jgi:hypothetical protein